MSEPTQKDLKNLSERVGEFLELYAYPESGEVSWDWQEGKWYVRMRLGDEWTGEDVEFVVED